MALGHPRLGRNVRWSTPVPLSAAWWIHRGRPWTSGISSSERPGDHDAFGALVDATIAGLEAVARLILRDHELARDAVQDTYIKAWRDLPGLREPDRFEASLHRLLVDTCLDTLRRRQRQPVEVELAPVARPSVDDDDRVGRRPGSARAWLPPAGAGSARGPRAALLVGISIPMVAETLGVPLGTGQSRLGRTLATLRPTLGPEFDTEHEPLQRGGIA